MYRCGHTDTQKHKVFFALSLSMVSVYVEQTHTCTRLSTQTQSQEKSSFLLSLALSLHVTYMFMWVYTHTQHTQAGDIDQVIAAFEEAAAATDKGSNGNGSVMRNGKKVVEV